MPVTDHHVAMLRALLTGRQEDYRRLLAGLDQAGGFRPYLALVNCAFIEAAGRRFGPGTTSEDVAGFVTGVAARMDGTAELDPELTARVLLTAIADGTVTGLEPSAVRAAQQYLLASLIVDEQLDDAGLDAVLARARELADAHLAVAGGP